MNNATLQIDSKEYTVKQFISWLRKQSLENIIRHKYNIFYYFQLTIIKLILIYK